MFAEKKKSNWQIDKLMLKNHFQSYEQMFEIVHADSCGYKKSSIFKAAKCLKLLNHA